MSHPYQPPKQRRGPLPWILGGISVILVSFLALGMLGAILEANEDPDAPASSTTAAPAAKGDPQPADFQLAAKVLDRTCYGDNGCDITWLPIIAYTGPALDDDETWLVAYQVNGVESGTRAGKIVFGSTGPARQSEKRGRTANEEVRITLKVTSVEKSE